MHDTLGPSKFKIRFVGSGHALSVTYVHVALTPRRQHEEPLSVVVAAAAAVGVVDAAAPLVTFPIHSAAAVVDLTTNLRWLVLQRLRFRCYDALITCTRSKEFGSPFPPFISKNKYECIPVGDSSVLCDISILHSYTVI